MKQNKTYVQEFKEKVIKEYRENKKLKVEISRSQKLKSTLVDYGKGRKNVAKISRILTSGVRPKSTP